MPHTPGPWLDRHWDDNQQITITAAAFRGPNVLALVRPPLTVLHSGTDDEIWECLPADVDEAGANARLIAAAPDLLAALKSCLIWHGELTPCDEPDDGLRGLLLEMEAAIAKATGQ